MRIWDIEPKYLCRQHLLGEHRELHAIWSILVNNKQGYRNHPETKRWIGKLKALSLRHKKLVAEMGKRGYRHLSPLDTQKMNNGRYQKTLINSRKEQKQILQKKNCPCFSVIISSLFTPLDFYL